MCVPHTCNDSNIICRLFRKFRFIGLYYYLPNGLQQWAFLYLIFGLFSARFMFMDLSDIDETAQAKVGAEIWTVKPDKAPHSKGTKSKSTVLT